MITFRNLLAISALCFGAPVWAERAVFAVATNFAETAEVLGEAFGSSSGHEIVFAFGSTGKLYAQIVNYAPFHGFLAADQLRPQLLYAAGLGDEPFTYANGVLVWLPATPKVEGRLAIANPELAPYGRAAREVLINAGTWDSVRDNLVLGENIGQTFAMVATGNAAQGLVALSSVLSARNPSNWAWSEARGYAPIRQDGILLNLGSGNAAAEGFLEYLKSPKAKAVIEASGYQVPSDD